MASIALIIFREVLEISLILGVLLAATRGTPGRSWWVSYGLGAGLLGSLAVAYFAGAISSAAQGMGQEIFNAIVLVLAALLIGWTVLWMRRNGAHLSREFKDAGRAVVEGRKPIVSLAIVTALAVLREGSEMVLFTYGVVASGVGLGQITGGSVLGLFAGGLLGALLYFGLVKIPTRHLFSVLGTLLIFLAAGMVAQALGFLTAAGVAPEIVTQVWDSSGILPEQGLAGKLLHALFGYTERPSGIQLIGYLLTLGGFSIMLKRFGVPKKTIAMVAITACLIGSSGNAEASKKVYSPLVEQGELELEYRGGVTFDDRNSKDDKQKHKFAVGYGVTDRWFTEIYGILENHPSASGSGDLDYEETEWENRFQISEQGEWFIDTGFYVAYEFAAEDEDADKLEMKLLLERSIDRWTHRANPVLEKEFGGDSEEKWEGGASWSSSYRLDPAFEPGMEVYWEYGEFGESRGFDEQKLQIGPVAYGQIGSFAKYEVGYLFGVSEDAPDGELKWVVEFEWHF